MEKPFKVKRYYGLACDPIHVGTGGYRLGRVDNTIIREPGTNLPKIPGSSIAGPARAFTAMAIQSQVDNKKVVISEEGAFKINPVEYKKMKYLRPKYKIVDDKVVVTTDGKPCIELNDQGKEIYLSCAGKGGAEGDGHCGENDCPVCVSFGFSKKGNSFQGLAQFTDARILFFPVHSMVGPVWISCPSVLKEIEAGAEIAVNGDTFRPINHEYSESKLNFGWLMLPKATEGKIDLSMNMLDLFPGFASLINRKTYLVPDRLFSRIVNDNLEVRTSVAIDPMTGAAEEGALYTYEAIPRFTILWFDIIYNKPEYFKVLKDNAMVDINRGEEGGKGIDWVIDHVEKGLHYIETLGLGGMNTRGMGRIQIKTSGEVSS